MLEWFKNNNYPINNTSVPINYAAINGHANVLDWFNNSNYVFEYSEDTINYAAEHGHTNILDWFKNSDYELKYSENTTNYAVINGHTNVLDWFKNSDYELKYSENTIDNAVSNGCINVLMWFNNYEQLDDDFHNKNYTKIYKKTKTCVKYSNNSFKRECPICLADNIANLKTICDHMYCEKCFVNYYLIHKHKKICAICKQSLILDDKLSIEINNH